MKLRAARRVVCVNSQICTRAETKREKHGAPPQHRDPQPTPPNSLLPCPRRGITGKAGKKVLLHHGESPWCSRSTPCKRGANE